MRKLLLLMAAMLAFAVAAPAFAGSDESTFDKGFAKLVPTIEQLTTNFKPRLYCLCTAASPYTRGVVADFGGGGGIACGVPGFASGALYSMTACSDFIVLH